MKLAKVRDWLEVVGLFAVVLSLIFVGLEVKQSKDIAIAAELQARTDMWNEWYVSGLESQFTAELMGEAIRDGYLAEAAKMPNSEQLIKRFSSYSDEELGYYHFRNMQLFKIWENLHLQHEMGFLDQDIWDASVRRLALASQSSRLWVTLNTWRDSFREPFFDLLLELKARSAAPEDSG